jgi:hypothetical protein
MPILPTEPIAFLWKLCPANPGKPGTMVKKKQRW